jgi:hypothetical protein
MAGELVARHGDDSVRLADDPCTSETVLAQLDPRLHLQFKAASAVVQGRTFAACWSKAGNVAYLLYEDGDQGMVPIADLKLEMST